MFESLLKVGPSNFSSGSSAAGTGQFSELQQSTRNLPPAHPADLISLLLREQSVISAVDEFSEWHRTCAGPEQARHYRNLMPASMPREGQQLAFEVDLDQCSGCKACVVACHSLNGLDDGESFRDVGVLVSLDPNSTALQHITTACHHCIDPACLNACPVNAYEKDPVTGIVRHLDDQCFGCQYCTLACPYEVPQYHAAKGIVRKCDMCSQRLSVGEAPACVQACPHQAISIRTIDIADAKAIADAGTFLSDSPDPGITLPTTRFIGKATSNVSMRAGNYATRGLEHAHWPLIVLLVLSQVATGTITLVLALNLAAGWDQKADRASADSANVDFVAGSKDSSFADSDAQGKITTASTQTLSKNTRTFLLSLAAVLAACAAISSTLHLGRPQFAYRAILGFGHSWLSREIVAFAVFIPMCFASAWLSFIDSPWLNLSLLAAVIFGVAGVVASVMIYHVTHRPFWHARRSVPLFFSTALGSASIIVLMAILVSTDTPNPLLLRGLACITASSAILKLLISRHALTTASQMRSTSLESQLLLQTVSACTVLLLGVVLAFSTLDSFAVGLAAIAIMAVVLSEFSERYLYFRAVVPLRMPGVVRS